MARKSSTSMGSLSASRNMARKRTKKKSLKKFRVFFKSLELLGLVLKVLNEIKDLLFG